MSESDIEIHYDPEQLLDAVIERMKLRSDAALGRSLRVAPSTIQKVRRGQRAINASLLICLHEQSGFSIKELRTLLGDRRRRFRIGKLFIDKNKSQHDFLFQCQSSRRFELKL